MESHQIFVIGSPAEIKERQTTSKSKMDDISSKIDKIETTISKSEKWIDFHTNKVSSNRTKLEQEKNKLVENETLKKASSVMSKYKGATAFGFSKDGELRIKIKGKWVNENLQEFVKVSETKMSKKMESKN